MFSFIILELHKCEILYSYYFLFNDYARNFRNEETVKIMLEVLKEVVSETAAGVVSEVVTEEMVLAEVLEEVVVEVLSETAAGVAAKAHRAAVRYVHVCHQIHK